MGFNTWSPEKAEHLFFVSAVRLGLGTDVRYCLSPGQGFEGLSPAQRGFSLPATGLRSTQISSLEPPWGPLDGEGEL